MSLLCGEQVLRATSEVGSLALSFASLPSRPVFLLSCLGALVRYLVIYIRTYRQSESLSRATYRSCCASQEPRTAPEKVLPPAIPKCTYYMRVRVVNLLPTALRPLPRDTITRGSPTQPSAIFLHAMYIKGLQAELGGHAPTAVRTRRFASRSCGCRAIGSLGPNFIKQLSSA